ncbi:ATP-dependent RNA helicase dhx29 [Kappamyces sp. JEL0680]|nr:ATP-dependent RNA helicase dhx29 [Kappamyces sp. JEL0680]
MPKKKPSSNRGFSTTSVPSKSQASVQRAADPEPVDDEPEFVTIVLPDASAPTKPAKSSELADKEALKLNAAQERAAKLLAEDPSVGRVVLLPDQEEALLARVSYLRLVHLGWDLDTVEQALRDSRAGSWEDLVQWMCMNLSHELLLARGWTDKGVASSENAFLTESVVHPSASDLPPEKAATQPNLEPLDPVRPSSRQDADSDEINKEWILAQASSRESSFDDDIDGHIIAKPVSRKELEEELRDWQEKAALAKQEGDKSLQKTCGREIARLVGLLGKGSELAFQPPQDTKGPSAVVAESSPTDEEFDMFLDESAIEVDPSVATPISVRDLTSRSKAGTSAANLLQEYVSKTHRGAKVTYNINHAFGSAYRASLSISGPQLDRRFEMDARSELVSTKEDAKNFVALKALYQMNPTLSFGSRLPPSYADLLKEWKDKALAAEAEAAEALAQRRTRCVEQVFAQRSAAAVSSEEKSAPKGTKEEPPRKKKIPTLQEWQLRQTAAPVQDLLQTRSTLPIYASYGAIKQALQKSRVLVISGETGSGKSTQIPQFLLQMAIESQTATHFNLACSQPRRISAVSLASRVSREIGDEALGTGQSWVGYQVKNDSKTGARSCLTFCTTGVLLRRILSDRLLSGLTHVVVDECHERSLESDLLLLLLKQILLVRTDLVVVLMSATANAQQFVDYFDAGQGRVVEYLSIPGRSFPVTPFFLEDVLLQTKYVLPLDSPYEVKRQFVTKSAGSAKITGRGGKQYTVQLTWQEAMQDSEEEPSLDPLLLDDEQAQALEENRIAKMIAKMNPKKINFDLVSHLIRYIQDTRPGLPAECDSGTVIVFLPGVGEIHALKELLESDFSSRNDCSLWILPLHSRLSTEEQGRVFLPPPRGKLKVVLSTNVAETGITIPDVVYVVDTVRAREVHFSEKSGLTRLMDTLVSKANVLQRRGRAGRVRPGLAFHLVPQDVFDRLPDHQLPEMMRLPLEEICLKMKSVLDNQNSIRESFAQLLDPPPPKNVDRAVKLLKDSQALDAAEAITKLGELLGQLPVDVRLGKCLVLGLFFGCIDPLLTVCSILSLGKSPFLFPAGDVSEAKVAHQTFHRGKFTPTNRSTGNSDMLSWLHAFSQWQQMWFDGKTMSSIQAFCRSNYLSFEVLVLIHENRILLAQALSATGLLYIASPLKQSRYPKCPLDLDGQANRHASNLGLVSAVYAAGMYPNIAILDPGSSRAPPKLHLQGRHIQAMGVSLHNTSTVDLTRPSSLFFTYNAITVKPAAQNKTQAVVFDLTPFSGFMYVLMTARHIDWKGSILVLDSSITLRCCIKTASVLLQLRHILAGHLDQFVRLRQLPPQQDVDLVASLF